MTTEELFKLAEEQRRLAQVQREIVQQLKDINYRLQRLETTFGDFDDFSLRPIYDSLSRDFKMATVSPIQAWKDGQSLKIDVFGYAKGPEGDAVVVKVESHLREEGLEQMRKILKDFREFFPEHAQRKVYGILAAVDVPDDLREQVLKEGIYLARIHDGQFDLQVPDGFQPRPF